MTLHHYFSMHILRQKNILLHDDNKNVIFTKQIQKVVKIVHIFFSILKVTFSVYSLKSDLWYFEVYKYPVC